MSDETKHPPPWRWADSGELVDANGAVLIGSEDAFPVKVASPDVRAVTEAAPEMEVLLRAFLARYDNYYSAASHAGVEVVGSTLALLAKIEAARKAAR